VTERARLGAATLLVAALAASFWSALYTVRVDHVDGDGEIEAAEAAVRAWGSFAGTGDIDSISEWFAAEGPQYMQLETEVAAIVPSAGYNFDLRHARLIEPGLVRGSVLVTTPNDKPQEYQWDIELVREAGRWKVWTVRTSPAEP
jgi:hypothetical protein